VLFGERDQVSFAQPVVLVGQRNLRLSEFAAFGAEVLGAGVEPVDLDVRRVGDQRDVADVACLGQFGPARSGARPCLARKRSAACAISRWRPENASRRSRGTPAISK
jgi:hypothetical protein